MKTSWVARARTLLFPPTEPIDGATDRSAYERFAIPFTFKPQLSLLEAFIAASTTFVRIFLGCLLFAVWGSYTLWAWTTIQSLFLRVAAVLAMVLLFVVLCLVCLLATAKVARIFTPRQR